MKLALAIMLLLTAPAVAQEAVRVIDGDTLAIGEDRIRLHGMDAPERDQTCERDGELWACGKAATEALRGLMEGATVTCESRGEDRYGRIIGVCTAGEVNLNASMVRSGFAVAYRKYSLAYVDEEKAAEREERGMWAGEFVMPWEWRRR